jgi:hypothetical protein
MSSIDTPDYVGEATAGPGWALNETVLSPTAGQTLSTPIVYVGNWQTAFMAFEQDQAQYINYAINWYTDPLGAAGAWFGQSFVKMTANETNVPLPIYSPWLGISVHNEGTVTTDCIIAVSQLANDSGSTFYNGLGYVIFNGANSLANGANVALTPSLQTPGTHTLYSKGIAGSTIELQTLRTAGFTDFLTIPTAAGVPIVQQFVVGLGDWQILVTNGSGAVANFELAVI